MSEEEYSSLSAMEYGEEHRKFLKESNPKLFKSLSESGDLEQAIHSVGEDAAEVISHLSAKALDETRGLPYLERTRELQSRHLSAEETVRHDLIHQPLPDDETP
jgi:hypothetical protein